MSSASSSWEELLASLPYPSNIITRVRLFARLAEKAAQSIRRCFPVKGRPSPFEGAPADPVAPQVVNVVRDLAAAELVLNPQRLPFDSPGRRMVFDYLEGCLMPGGAAGIAQGTSPLSAEAIGLTGRVVGWLDRCLRHYRLEAVVGAPGGPLSNCGWTWPDVPEIDGAIPDALEEDAQALDAQLDEERPVGNALLEALGQPCGTLHLTTEKPPVPFITGSPPMPASEARPEEIESDEGDSRRDARPSVCVSPGRPNQHRFGDWAFGIEHGQRWRVFKKHRGEWRDQGILEGVKGGLQSRLLRAFAEGGGSLTMSAAIKSEAPGCGLGDKDKIKGRIKPAMSNLRQVLRTAMGIQDKTDPLPFDDPTGSWQARVEIGYAVENDGEHIGGEQRLRFKHHHDLTDDERLDRQ